MPFGPDREFPGVTLAGRLKAAGPGPFPDDLFSATDIHGLPWTRKRGDEWTDATFRAVVLDFVRVFFRDRADHGLIGWDITERANGDRMGSTRLPASQHYLLFGVTKRLREVDTRVETAINFDIQDRISPNIESRLVFLAGAIDVQLTAIV